MATTLAILQREYRQASSTRPSDVFVAIARVLYSAIFMVSGFTHFAPEPIQYAAQIGVPLPELLVPLSGLMAFAGGLSIAVGYRARLGAWLLVLFLVPVTLTMHAFWAMEDPMMAQMHQAMFLKNAALLGAALLIAKLGAGPFSVDARWGPSR